MDEKNFHDPLNYTNELEVINSELAALKKEVNANLEIYFLKDEEFLYKQLTIKNNKKY